MIAFNICVLNWPNGGAVDLGAESFASKPMTLRSASVCERVIFTPDAVDAQNVNGVHLRPLGRPDA
jgi:hypothetical protein